ncbi:unnamed protein product [Nippostrongylus brasiliensis]|uniref:EGF-like domain-containing protein n=1 Tax=Nippostrongylus brasiliensis TaxID=27835 RepID=A0A0N4YR36_NIPBR|nr:unnamed protein product [Nippostrongylus brasiliensis]
MVDILYSVDRGFCLDRCSEIGVCYKTTADFICYCYDGTVSENCGVMSSTEAEVSGWKFGFWHFVAVWLFIGLIVGCCEILCIIIIMHRRLRYWILGPVVEAVAIDELRPQAELPMLPLEATVVLAESE